MKKNYYHGESWAKALVGMIVTSNSSFIGLRTKEDKYSKNIIIRQYCVRIVKKNDAVISAKEQPTMTVQKSVRGPGRPKSSKK